MSGCRGCGAVWYRAGARAGRVWGDGDGAWGAAVARWGQVRLEGRGRGQHLRGRGCAVARAPMWKEVVGGRVRGKETGGGMRR